MKKNTHLEDMEAELLKLESIYCHSDLEAAAMRLCMKMLPSDLFDSTDKYDKVKSYVTDLLML
ncbi:hypothetical protein VXS06_14720 [Photobacterium toruni]|uniref:Uncharacterized protein n=1 Tax=Photobacterium toruni TaxID=1935446 RepID=A0ABU6L8V6_9GAMM|nr:hypothetical protein [Photobacterium toruni]